ncbi:head-tail connector (endogenous virus) [Gutovirus Vc1]|uniref:Head-tail connector n=1 Tax=Vibrio phage Vc1 TaxID=1480731 RepID=X2KU50_9CAUD|nr:head-tail adaptor [Vibrio phage Vc1]AHN84656.1 head-tail connector [Vibrio phage Vc1]
MAKGYNPQIIEKPRVLDLTNKMRVKDNSGNKDATIRKRYEALKTRRDPFLARARTFSSYTIPNLYPLNFGMPNQGDGSNTTGWQSFGAECVNTINNKLVMTLFPPHTSFAHLELTPKAKEMLLQEDLNVVEQEGSLVNAEQQAILEHERIAGRVGLGEALEHLVVGGTTCLYMPEEGNLINYPLDRFVCRRDKSGNLLELVLEESKSIDMFEPAVQAIIKAKGRQSSHNSNGNVSADEVNLYTHVKWKNGFYHIAQEVVDVEIGERYRVRKENLPFIVLRWKTNYGEDYGRSLVEQHAGDLHVIQFLSEALAKGMILMADVKYLIKPGSVTDVDHLIESPTGEFIYGNIDDIGVLQLEKYADFTPIQSVLDKYERRVGRAFMLGTQRDAERVTAYEVRQDALQMENSLGGAYTLLALTLQRPYFQLLLNRIGFDLPENLVNTVITTGIEALSKMGDADKFLQWTEAMQAAATLPEMVQARMKWGDFAKHTASQLSLSLDYMMTEEEFREQQAQQQQVQQQNMAMEAAVKAAPQMLSKQQPQ